MVASFPGVRAEFDYEFGLKEGQVALKNASVLILFNKTYTRVTKLLRNLSFKLQSYMYYVFVIFVLVMFGVSETSLYTSLRI